MREIRKSGSEGGGTETNRFSLPLSPAATRAKARFVNSALQGASARKRRRAGVSTPGRGRQTTDDRLSHDLWLREFPNWV
jgi:hypothetical protein